MGPVLGLTLLCGLLFPATAWALLQRQLQQDVEIPRSVAVESAAAEIWPSAEEITLTFKAHGPGAAEGRSGTVRIRGKDGNAFSVPLQLLRADGPDAGTYVARVPPGSVDFLYTAKLGDGRMRLASRVRYVPRPNVIQQDAYLILPKYIGLQYQEDQAGYLAGIVAGSITKSKIVGAIGGINLVPAVVRYIQGYELGAKSVDASITVKTAYVSTSDFTSDRMTSRS